MVSTVHGFFLGTKPISGSIGAKDSKSVLVDVGGNGDCGFRAVAAGLIDNFLTHPRANGDLLNNVLTSHFAYFPEHRTTLPGLVTPAERMQQLMKQVRMSELLQALAYTLRQIAVTEMCTHPEIYRGAFVDHNEQTAPADMRKATTWIDESSIAALAKALTLSIEVQVVERLKTLPMRLHYNHAPSVSTPVVIQLQNGHYIPRLSSSDCFSSVSTQQPARALHPKVDALPADPDLAEIHKVIAAEDKRLVETFEETYHRLAIMVTAGELDKAALLDIYVKGMTHSDYLSGRVACIGVERGNQDFFDMIISAQGGVKKGGDYDQQITGELIHALARAITIGQMSADKVFSDIDSSQEHRSGPK